ncbi:DUF881 domain-containing protein [Clostridium cellulovorans]|uniref:Division initiation protein n=1 Tax=Clostridium cellulovorans (strain ATCC 35296 / DSM 3052 / OCM 3 / 743B) TaxID=573061 RepID=D9SKK7_CLOC7|nr:DUF881 domain-containing protein [Clostridium cellulovorans]ADL51503.1 protein of unknown function DUF881 [Clostridium cellulovorans 743B]
MKNNEATIFLFLAAIIVGVLIVSNFSFGANATTVTLNAQEYFEATNEKNELLGEITSILEEKEQLEKKLRTYKYRRGEIENEFKKEIDKYVMLNGLVALEGSGVEILMDDYVNFKDEPISGNNIHNTDVLAAINDLRVMGAEAISINGIRIVYNTEIYCFGADLTVNGIAICAPFKISAIGDGEKMEAYLNSLASDLGYIKNLRINLIIDIKRKDKIFIPSFDTQFKSEYMDIPETRN